ncbi:hypothetical protein C8J57DRAFT_1314304 [Mycena rebaudengoi]|nr:hypothetical protein C8J57DRAFT_1314304 [Mycena rebaudengoi]
MLGSLFSLLILYLHSTFAKLVTTLIDDAFPGDTQSSVSYSPAESWGPGSSTSHGRVSPDASKAQFGTWHDTTADTELGTTPTFMEVIFRGTGIDLRCIIANNKAAILPGTGTKSNYSFFIDSVAQNRDFVHEAGTTGDALLYNMSVFRIDGLSNDVHTVKLLANGGPGVDGSVLLLFDYAIVTSDDGTGDGSSITSAGGVNTSQRPPTAPSTQSSPAQPSPSSPSAAHKSNIVAIVGGAHSVSQKYLFFWMPTVPLIAPRILSSSGLGLLLPQENIDLWHRHCLYKTIDLMDRLHLLHSLRLHHHPQRTAAPIPALILCPDQIQRRGSTYRRCVRRWSCSGKNGGS